jgi:signal transduction histidine kinase
LNGTTFSFNPLIFNLSTSIFELLAFTTGLAFKANLMEKEKTRAGEILIEKLNENIRLQEKMNSIRHDAAKELHDEVAGGLSDISIYSEIVTRNIDTQLDKEQQLLRQIRSKALNMMDSIHDLIWALNPANQTIGDLDNKLTLISREHLAPVNASWKIDFLNELKQFELEPDSMRRIVSVYRTFLTELSPAGIVGTQIQLNNLTSIDIYIRLQTTPDKNKLTDRLLHLINKYKVKIDLSDRSVCFNLPITTISD